MASIERGRVPSPLPIAVKEVPLIDRLEEMKLLKETADRAIQGGGGVVFLSGEAGIGKTRLARELRAYAHMRGMQVLYGRCPALFRMDGVPPYIIWKEVIKDYLETCTLEQLDRVIGFYPAEVAKLVPEIVLKLRTVPQSSPISPEQEQNRLFEAVSQLITNISKDAPLLVVLDDLQWTDPSSLLLLHYLARGVQKTPLLLLGAYRSTDIDASHPLTPVLAELRRERLPQSVSLKRMSLDDISELIRQILEQDDIPSEFCKVVYEKTRGNPFFAEEVIESLKEEEAIYKEKDKWEFKEIDAIEFPESVKNVLKTRLSRLDEDCKNVLTMASFIGNDFTLETMCTVTGIEKSKLLKLMDNLFKTGLIKERVTRGEGICSFADILIRDVVYEEVSPLTRKELHGVIGSALEKVYEKTIDEHLGELASHFIESGDKEKALEYFLKAGEKAAAVYANTEAASYFQSALRLLEDREDKVQQKGHVLERLGDIKKLSGDSRNCIKYWDQALSLSIKLHEKEKTATLHRKIANVLWNIIGDFEKAEEHQEASLDILEAQPKSVELARLYEDMAHMLWRKGEVPKALSWAEKALALAEKLNALEVVADSCNELAVLCGIMADYKKSLEYAHRALKIALDNNYLETALWAHYRVANALPPEDYEKSLEHHEKGVALAKKIGDIGLQAMHMEALARRHMFFGQLDKAIALSEEILALDKRIGAWTFGRALILYDLEEAYWRSGDWKKSEQFYEEALSFSEKLNEYQLKSCAHFVLGRRQFNNEEYVKAKESFEEALKVLENAGVRAIQDWAYQFLIRTLIELGETEKAASLIDKLRWFSQETGDKSFIVDEMTLRSTLLRAQKKYEESIDLFEKTLKECESIRANVWNAYDFTKWVLCEYARAYLERGQKDDKEKSLSLLSRALEMFQKMGAKKDIEKVEARIAFIETGKVISKPKPIDHISTGHEDLDKLLYGGIPSSCAVVLTSPSCNERDLLIRSFLETGAKKGEVTFFVTIDPGAGKPLAEEFQSSFYLFVCNPQADAIIQDSPNVFKLKGVENLTDIGIALTSAMHKLGPSIRGSRRICISLLSDLLLQHHAVQTRRWLTALIAELKSNGFTILAAMNPRIHPQQELEAILDLFEGEINIREKETERGSEKYLKIKRLGNQKYLENELLLRRESPE